MNEPERKSYTHEEAVQVALNWMRENYGPYKNLMPDQKDRYDEKCGLLCHFLDTLHPTK